MSAGVGGGAAIVPPQYAQHRDGDVVCPLCNAHAASESALADHVERDHPGVALNDDTEKQWEQFRDRVKAFHFDFDMKVAKTKGDGTLVLEGYGNTWDVDRDGETTARKAFDQDLGEYMQNPQLLLQHDRHKVLGLITFAKPDEKGLFVRAEIPKPDPGSEPWHIKAYNDIKRGLLRCFSMGGVFIRQKAANVIERVKLMEISVVTIPSNPTSMFRVAEEKGLTWAMEVKDGEAAIEAEPGEKDWTAFNEARASAAQNHPASANSIDHIHAAIKAINAGSYGEAERQVTAASEKAVAVHGQDHPSVAHLDEAAYLLEQRDESARAVPQAGRLLQRAATALKARKASGETEGKDANDDFANPDVQDAVADIDWTADDAMDQCTMAVDGIADDPEGVCQMFVDQGGLAFSGGEGKGDLSTDTRNDLPDSAFAAVYTDADGNKQRKLPYKHADGSIDEAHLRNALGRAEQPDTDLPPAVRSKARAALQSAASGAGIGKSWSELVAGKADDLIDPSVDDTDTSDIDETDDPGALAQAIDQTLDDLQDALDDEDYGTAGDLATAAEATVDALLDALGVSDDDNSDDAGAADDDTSDGGDDGKAITARVARIERKRALAGDQKDWSEWDAAHGQASGGQLPTAASMSAPQLEDHLGLGHHMGVSTARGMNRVQLDAVHAAAHDPMKMPMLDHTHGSTNGKDFEELVEEKMAEMKADGSKHTHAKHGGGIKTHSHGDMGPNHVHAGLLPYFGHISPAPEDESPNAEAAEDASGTDTSAFDDVEGKDWSAYDAARAAVASTGNLATQVGTHRGRDAVTFEHHNDPEAAQRTAHELQKRGFEVSGPTSGWTHEVHVMMDDKGTAKARALAADYADTARGDLRTALDNHRAGHQSGADAMARSAAEGFVLAHMPNAAGHARAYLADKNPVHLRTAAASARRGKELGAGAIEGKEINVEFEALVEQKMADLKKFGPGGWPPKPGAATPATPAAPVAATDPNAPPDPNAQVSHIHPMADGSTITHTHANVQEGHDHPQSGLLPFTAATDKPDASRYGSGDPATDPNAQDPNAPTPTTPTASAPPPAADASAPNGTDPKAPATDPAAAVDPNAAPAADPSSTDPANLTVGGLITGLVSAIEEVNASDQSDDDKIKNIEQFLADFGKAKPGAAPTAAPTDPVPAAGAATEKFIASLGGKAVRHSASIKVALARLREKEAQMGVDDTGGQLTASAGTKADHSADDRDEVITRMAKRLDEMEAKEHEADIERKAEEEAARRIAAEQNQAHKEHQAAEGEAKRISDLVDQKMAAVRSGRKFAYTPVSVDPSGGEDEKAPKNLGEMLVLLRESKKGDYEAYKTLQEINQKANVEYFGTKALNAGAGGGGYLVPPQFWQQGIAEFRLAAAKMRPLCTIIPGIQSNLVYLPRETGISTVGWVGDNATKPSTDQSFGQIAVNIFTLAGISKVANQFLDDSAPAVDMIVRKDLGRTLGQAEDIAFLNGSGSGQPTGILNTANVLTGAIGAAKLADAIATAITSIQSNYFGDPEAIVAHPREVNVLRLAKDSNGRYIFEPAFFAGVTPQNPGASGFLAPQQLGGGYSDYPAAVATPVGSIWGLPVISDGNMPTTLGGGTESPVIVGAFKECYILDRQGVTLDVSNEAGTSFEQNQTWFRGEERLGFTAARQPSSLYVITGLTPTAG